jgi:hypothetical protein
MDMDTVYGRLSLPPDEAMNACRTVAAQHGYALAEGQGEPNVLVLKKGVSVFSWGSALTARFEAASPTGTEVTVTTSETFALTDWGRGKRAARKLLDALGAEHF